ncbi:hypothetical protein AC249_AIPGENE17471, partial [Exaiptasia diaphana]
SSSKCCLNMNRRKFIRYLKLLLGIALLFSSVLPLDSIAFGDSFVAENLKSRKLCDKSRNINKVPTTTEEDFIEKEDAYSDGSDQSRFTKCIICVHLKEQLRNPRLDAKQRRRMTNMRKVHLLRQMAERRNYYMHGIKARLEPNRYLSMMLDGMDQNKTRIPHFSQTTKIDDGLGKLKTHITGVLVNARSTAYAYVDVCEYPHDPNLTINLIMSALSEEQKKQGKLPPILYLQMDNCGRENKNAAVLSFLGLLVQLELFVKV